MYRNPLNDTWLARELDGFDPAVPIEAAWLPPSSWYVERGVHDVERDTVFKNSWLIAARADQVAGAGDFVAGRVADEPYVVVRGGDGALRAFYNVCRHHAAQVMIGEGCTDTMVCPYHGWSYALDGRLLSAPELGGVRDFDRDCFGLVPMHVEEWGPFVFISMAKEPRPLADDLPGLRERLDGMNVGALAFVERRTYTIACNWKVYVDNYLDGGYHVSHLHRGLAAQLDLSSYKTEVFERYSIQSGAGAAVDDHGHGDAGAGGGGDDADARDFAKRVGDRVLYAWLYPNFMINRYGPMMDTNWVLPRGHDSCEVVFDYYFLEPERSDPDFVAKALAASDVVQAEDIAICESVQRGLGSSSYDRGRYSVKREMGEHSFHRLLAADFAARRR